MLENELFFGSLFWVILDRFWRQNGGQNATKNKLRSKTANLEQTLALRIRIKGSGLSKRSQIWYENAPKLMLKPCTPKSLRKERFWHNFGSHFGAFWRTKCSPKPLWKNTQFLEDFGSPGGSPGGPRRYAPGPSGDMGKWHLGLEMMFFLVFFHIRRSTLLCLPKGCLLRSNRLSLKKSLEKAT